MREVLHANKMSVKPHAIFFTIFFVGKTNFVQSESKSVTADRSLGQQKDTTTVKHI